MSLVNLGYSYYRKIEDIDEIDLGKKIIDRAHKTKVSSEIYFNIDESYKMTFKTLYPSMVIGLGYAHDLDGDNDFKLGFLFDYTSGLPYIPGSSVKGVIRSMFPLNKEDKERLCFINQILGKELQYSNMLALERSIFGKTTKDKGSIDDTQSKDIFYDGYFGTSIGGFLSSDNITPHEDEITSPKPLKFLKITPDTKVTLQFKLKENSLLSKEERLNLYTKILQYTGLGAKTNVGYGVVDTVKYGYREIRDIETIKKFFEAVKQNIKEAEENDIDSTLPEHEQIAKKANNSTNTMIKVLQKNKCSSDARKPLAELIKSILQKNASTWKNAKKGALKNKEFIEEVLKD